MLHSVALPPCAEAAHSPAHEPELAQPEVPAATLLPMLPKPLSPLHIQQLIAPGLLLGTEAPKRKKKRRPMGFSFLSPSLSLPAYCRQQPLSALEQQQQ